MKIARLLSISVVGLFVMTHKAGADPRAEDDTPDVPPSPYTQSDPDGVPLAVSEKHTNQEALDELNAFHQQDKQEEKNKDWLLSSYEHQLQTHAGTAQGQQGNLYYQLTSNKDLARLAGLPTLDDSDKPNLITDKTGISPAASSSAQLRKDGSAGSNAGSPGADVPKPMMRSFGSIDSGGMHSLFSSSSLPLAMPSPLAANLIPQPTQPAPVANNEDQPSDLSMPGMIAAKNSTLEDPTDSDLDVLPGESLEHARDHQDSNSLLELSLPMNADQLHKAQTTAAGPAAPANATASAQTTKTPPAANAKPADNQEDPTPVSKELPINPVRAPIANPYDILNR